MLTWKQPHNQLKQCEPPRADCDQPLQGENIRQQGKCGTHPEALVGVGCCARDVCQEAEGMQGHKLSLPGMKGCCASKATYLDGNYRQYCVIDRV